MPKNKIVGTTQNGENIYESKNNQYTCMFCGSKIYPGQKYTTPRVTRGYPCCNQCRPFNTKVNKTLMETIIILDNVKVDKTTQDVICEMIKEEKI
jgi:hypothetical protein